MNKVDFGLEYSLQLDFPLACYFSLVLYSGIFFHGELFFWFDVPLPCFGLLSFAVHTEVSFLGGFCHCFPNSPLRINGFIIYHSVFDSSEMLFCLLEWLRCQISHISPQMIIKFSFQKDFLLFSIMHMYMCCMSVYVHVLPSEAKRGRLVPWSWNDSVL